MARDQEYDNTMRGALFENTNTRGNKKAPQWRGQCTIQTPDGELVEYWISCWEQESRKGDPFLSLSFEEKEEDQRSDNRGRGRDRDDDRRSRGRDDRDDDRGTRRSVVGRGRDRDDRDDRGRDDDRRRRDDDRPATSTRKTVDEDLDDQIPFR